MLDTGGRSPDLAHREPVLAAVAGFAGRVAGPGTFPPGRASVWGISW